LTAPLVLYCTIVLLPEAPVESAPLPYSTHTDPGLSLIESGALPPTGPPVANTEEETVGAATADAPVARKTAIVDRALMRGIINVSPMLGCIKPPYASLAALHDRELTIDGNTSGRKLC
jgi:hypothetical protein